MLPGSRSVASDDSGADPHQRSRNLSEIFPEVHRWLVFDGDLSIDRAPTPRGWLDASVDGTYMDLRFRPTLAPA
jgi:hypothetical protein